ncbi:MAG: hypothetical protein WD491_02580 [Balneolales bacterium]
MAKTDFRNPFSGQTTRVQVDELAIGTDESMSTVRVQEAAIAFDDSSTALMTIPDDANILSIDVIVTTGFDGTTPTYDVGYSADADALVDGGTLSASAGQSTFSPPTATVAQWNGVTSGVLIGTFAGGGSNTAGAGTIRVTYFE